LALAAARGEPEKRKKEHYAFAADARARYDREADGIFFQRLWARFDAQDKGEVALIAEKDKFRRTLLARAGIIFEAALPAIPCASIFRPRAEARARRAFIGAIWKIFPELFANQELEGADHADA
jgi:CRISPR system Cascade subunit CasA